MRRFLMYCLSCGAEGSIQNEMQSEEEFKTALFKGYGPIVGDIYGEKEAK